MVALVNLTDVTITSLTAGDILYTANGSTWVNALPGPAIGIQPYNANTSFVNVAETRSASIDMNGHLLLRPVLRNYSEQSVNVVAAATTTLDLSTGNVFVISQATDITTLNITNIAAAGLSSEFTIIRVKDNSATSRAITWPASFKWKGGTAPTLTQTANAIDTMEFYTIDNGTTWYGFQSGLNML